MPSIAIKKIKADNLASYRNPVLDFYNLSEQPFGVTPDPRFLYPSSSHLEALASMQYGVTAGRGFTALIAPPGMGKTTLLFELLKRLPRGTSSVFLFQSQSTPRDLMQNLLSDLEGVDSTKDIAQLQSQLNDYLIRECHQENQLIIVVDEAQNLNDSVLESLRMLSNFETPRGKLLHIIMSGQPSLAEKLYSPSLIQLRQRISIIARLKPFGLPETRAFISHRLRVAGYSRAESLFTDQALALITGLTEGVPRSINNICFNAMSLGCATSQEIIGGTIIAEVFDDLDLSTLFQDKGPW